MPSKELPAKKSNELIALLEARFEKNPKRHQGIDWADVEKRLKNAGSRLWSLNEMESSGGEPDVVGKDTETGEFIFVDCSPESPKGRRSLCYDAAALDSRKENKPADSAVNMAEKMGIEILKEDEYRQLQQLDKFDLKTSSWIGTPPNIRKLGGAVFCDRRYDTVFLYHNGAESYYAARGFRASVRV